MAELARVHLDEGVTSRKVASHDETARLFGVARAHGDVQERHLGEAERLAVLLVEEAVVGRHEHPGKAQLEEPRAGAVELGEHLVHCGEGAPPESRLSPVMSMTL